MKGGHVSIFNLFIYLFYLFYLINIVYSFHPFFVEALCERGGRIVVAAREVNAKRGGISGSKEAKGQQRRRRRERDSFILFYSLLFLNRMFFSIWILSFSSFRMQRLKRMVVEAAVEQV